MSIGTNRTEQRLGELVSPVVEELGYRLWGLECTGRGAYSVLRLYIDSKNSLGEVTIDDVTRVSMLLDLEDPIQGSYSLEVSSPGIERRLFTLEQCQSYIGEQTELRLKLARDGRRAFKGRLAEVSGEQGTLTLEEEAGEQQKFHFDDVRRMQLIWQGASPRHGKVT